MFTALYNFVKRIVVWFAKSITDTERGGLSLSRALFLISVAFAQVSWHAGKEIPHFQFYFILINLSYILFKDRSLAILNKVMDTVAIVRGVTPTPPEKPATTETTTEQQLNG